MPIYEAECLTDAGRKVAFWATKVLHQFLGGDFPQRALESGHPILSLAFCWPANDVPWVYANLFQLAAQIRLLGNVCRPLRKGMQHNLTVEAWTHALLQLEMAGLGLRADWQCTFEPDLGTGRQTDLRVENDSRVLMVEIVAMGPPNAWRDADKLFDEVMRRKVDIEMREGVYLSGSLGESAPPEDLARWWAEIAATAALTGRDSAAHVVAGPTGGQIRISKDWDSAGSTVGFPMTSDIGARLVARLQDKNRQVTTGIEEPVWLRIEDHAGLWQFTELYHQSLPEKLVSLASYLRQELDAYPNIAGVILGPSVMWVDTIPDAVATPVADPAAGIAALRTPVPGHRCRETILVTRSGPLGLAGETFVDWYGQEATWLDWALERLNHPRFAELVQGLSTPHT